MLGTARIRRRWRVRPRAHRDLEVAQRPCPFGRDDARQKLVEQLELLLPEARRSEQLRILLTDLAEQKRRLQDDMEALESEPAEARSGAEPVLNAERDSAPHIGTLQTALSGQVSAIQSLQHLLLQARQEPDQTSIEQMEKHIAQLERQCREANTCVEIMEQENQRLQHRVERAGLCADRAAADSRESVAELQQQLDKKKRTITELHERLVSLKLEAEQAQALRGQLTCTLHLDAADAALGDGA